MFVLTVAAAVAAVAVLLHGYAAWSIRNLGRPVEIVDPGQEKRESGSTAGAVRGGRSSVRRLETWEHREVTDVRRQ